MVSFFGLKFGADKKKKADKSAEQKPPQQWKRIDQNTLGEGQFFGTNVGSTSVINGSIRSVPRPGTSHSTRSRSPFVYNTHNLAASSMLDLPNGGHAKNMSFSSLKPSSSDINLRMNFTNASSASLGIPGPAFDSRPGTPGGTRTKAWVNPLDVHFGRSGVSTPPKSSLGQFELNADLFNGERDGASLLGDKPETLTQAIMGSIEQREKERIPRENGAEREQGRTGKEAGIERAREREAGLGRQQERQQQPTAAARSPPPGPLEYSSPQGSMNGPLNGPADRPRFQGQIDQRPGSRGGLRNGPTMEPMDRPRFHGHADPRPDSRNGRRNGPTHAPASGLTNGPAKSPMIDPMYGQARSQEPSYGQNVHGPASLPSPTGSMPRSGEDLHGVQYDKPVIQNVSAKRDTLTISTYRKQSLTMKIEEFEKSLVDAQQAIESPRKDSGSSSHYDDENNGELAQEPQNSRRPSPPFAASNPIRTQSPIRAPPRHGQRPRRPNPDEYGVRMVPDSRPGPGGPGPMLGHAGQEPRRPGLADTPHFPPPAPRTGPPLQPRETNWREQGGEDRGMHPDKFTKPRPSPRPGVPDAVPNTHVAPSTPDSSGWPLPSPTISSAPPTQPVDQHSPSSSATLSPRLARPKVPPPLTFDFSPQAYSRANGPFTPPLRVNIEQQWHSSPEARPGTAAGSIPSVAPVVPAVDGPGNHSPTTGFGLGPQIGVARGLSVREPQGLAPGERRPNYGLKSPTGIADNFGTGFI